MAQNTTIVRAQEVLNYLDEIVRMGNKTIDRLEDHHDFLLYQNELPHVQNIKVNIDFFQLETDFLTVKRPDLPAPPPLPKVLEGWVEVPQDPDQELQVTKGRKLETEEECINFADDPERVSLYRTYLESWRFWAAAQTEDDNPFTKFLQVPALPDKLQEWVQVASTPTVEPVMIESRVVSGNESRIIEIAFAQDSQRVEALENYQRLRERWMAEIHPLNVALKLYDKLFRVRRELEYSEDLELVLGYGILSWEQDQRSIKYPIVTQNLMIQHNAKKNELALVTPDEFHWKLETEPLIGLEGVDLNELHTAFQNADYLESEENPLAGVLHQVAALSSEGQVIPFAEEVDLTPTQKLRVVDGWTVFVRKKNQHALIEDIQAFKDLLRQRDCQLPSAIARLVDDPKDIRQEWEGANHTEWSALLDQEILFPKPANEEQIKIVDSLKHSDGVVVQGPPGTGKSHTIANLIAHFMAHGQRVLVTSQKDQALKVLHQMLPDYLQPLCMPILKNDSNRKQKLEQAVDMITDIVTNRSPGILQREIEELSEEFESKRRDIEAVSQQLKKLAAVELPILTQYRDRELLPAFAARAVQEEAAQYRWFKDKPSYCKERTKMDNREVVQLFYQYPLKEEELRTLSELRKELLPKLADLQYYRLPKSTRLLVPADFIQMADELESLARLSEKANQYYPDLLLRKKGIDFDTILTLLKEGVQVSKAIQNTWANKFITQAIEFKEKLTQSLETLEVKFTNLEYLYSRLDILKDVKFYSDIDLKEYRHYVLEVLERLETGKKALGFHNLFGGKKKLAIQGLNINGQSPEGAQDWKQVLAQLDFQIAINEFCYNWSAFSKAFTNTYQVPPLIPESDYQELKDAYQLLQKAFDYHFYLKPQIQRALSEVIMGGEQKIQMYLDRELENIYQALQIKKEELAFTTTQSKYQHLKDYLTTLKESGDVHPVVDELLECLSGQLDQVKEYGSKWKVHFNKIVVLEELMPVYAKFTKLLTKLAKEAPHWVEMWLNPELTEEELHLSIWRKAWDHAVLNGYLDELTQRETKMAQLEELLSLYQRGLKKLKAKLILKKTELGLMNKITDANMVSLKKWKNAIKKLGKGTGKYAAAYRKEAQMHMQDARNAVPVWIMPVFSVSETIGREFEFFDVVIVDEASQCDLKSLLVLFRAKKVIIVGDDQQISPSAVGISKEQMNTLIKAHLRSFPHASMMEIQTSLYDLTQTVFNSRANIMLKEHFRCVPEIIDFSNQLCYNGNIQPLRNPPDSMRLQPTLQSIFVKGGYREERRQVNKPEAEAICEKVRELVGDLRYAGKTIGVISLTGSEQAKYILDLIDQYVSPQKQEEYAFHAGDSYAFQGDERDVIILSMVVGKGRRFTSISSDTYLQRYNVAMSRAKEQLILFHSVELDKDLTNPEDLRYQLLKFVQDGDGDQNQEEQVLLREQESDEEEELRERCDSSFEEDVYLWLIEKGYKVTPQVAVGHYRIDLVVEGERDRLALECDGDRYHSPEKWWDDRMCQRLLERVGWTFQRVSGSSFYRDREQAMQFVVERLEEMGIGPIYL